MTDQERMERSAAEAAHVRDRRLARIERERADMLAEAKRVYDERVARIHRDAAKARDATFWVAECHQDATRNFIETKNARALAAQVGLDVPFLNPSRWFGKTMPKTAAI